VGEVQESSLHSFNIFKPSEIHVKFYPDTGVLTPYTLNKVFFVALSDSDGTDVSTFDSADLLLINEATNSEDIILQNISCSNLGRGSFEFRVDPGPHDLFSSVYALRVRMPNSRVPRRFALPEVSLDSRINFRIDSSIIDRDFTVTIMTN